MFAIASTRIVGIEMTQVSTLQIRTTLADLLDVPVEEVRFDLDAHLADLDRELERDLDRYLAFMEEARC